VSEGLTVTIGVLVVTNLGVLAELTIAGRRVGPILARERESAGSGADCQELQTSSSGSLMVVLATDAPLSERQLGRLLRRVQNGVARTGSTTAHGSGEVVIGFTTHARIPHFPEASTLPLVMLREDGPLFDLLFSAVTEATEEAILNSLFNAESVTGRPKGILRDQPFPINRLRDLMT
jgi:D-aminopeptidase